MNLKDKKIIVTVGSRGIGQSTVQKLLEYGAKVAFTHTASSPEATAKVEEWVKSLANPHVKAFKLNLGEVASFKEAVASMTEFLGGLDCLVNNAGITADHLMLRIKEEDYDKVLDVNLKGCYFFTKECLRPLLKSDAPSVVFLSSVVAQIGNPGQSVYAASKAGMIGVAMSLAKELGSRNFRVNVVAPGFIDTDMTHHLPEEAKKAFLAGVPLGRFGQPQEVADCIAFLLSDLSRYVTGQVLSVNGGLYI